MVLTHTGSMFPGRDKAHPLNWSKQAWERSVGALKNIAKSTSGSKILIGIEPVNTEAINNPWAMKRLREDVGDSRIVCGLDITNMVNPAVAFRMTELMNITFEALNGMIGYIHAKDYVWNDVASRPELGDAGHGQYGLRALSRSHQQDDDGSRRRVAGSDRICGVPSLR